MSELEQKVSEQQRAMTVLLQDKANLESRVNIFVRVLQMRDEQIEQIRSGQRVRLSVQAPKPLLQSHWHLRLLAHANMTMLLDNCRFWQQKTKTRLQNPLRMT